jgi:hypothetical protein
MKTENATLVNKWKTAPTAKSFLNQDLSLPDHNFLHASAATTFRTGMIFKSDLVLALTSIWNK